VCVQSWGVLYGDSPLSTGDVSYITAMEREIISAVELAASSITTHLVFEDAALILQIVLDIVLESPSPSLLLNTTWLQAVGCAAMLPILRDTARMTIILSPADRHTPSYSLLVPVQNMEDWVCFFGSCREAIMEAMWVFKDVASAQWLGLLALRVLTRPPYMKGLEVDWLLVRNTPDEENYSLKSMPNKYNQRRSPLRTEPSLSMFTSRQNSSIDSEEQPDDDISTITGSVATHEVSNITGFLPTSVECPEIRAEFSFLFLLTECIMCHVQSDQVLEQWLLLIHQVSISCYPAKLRMVTADIDHTLKRVIGLRSGLSNYISMLCQICLDFFDEEGM